MTTGSSSLATVTLLGRLLATRFVTFYFALVTLDVGVAGLAVSEVRAITSAADIGMLVRPGTTVDIADPTMWPGVDRGDKVLALDGVATPTGRSFMDRRLVLEPGVHSVTFDHKGETFERGAQVDPIGNLAVFAVWTRWLNGVLVLLMGIAVFALRPGVRMSWLLFGFCQCVGIFLISLSLLQRESIYYLEAASTIVCGGMALAMWFYSAYPLDLGLGNRWRLVLSAPAIATAIGSPLLPHEANINYGFRVFAAITLMYVGLAVLLVALQIRLAKQRSDQTASRRSRAFLFAFGGGLMLPLLWDVVRRFFGIGLTPWSSYLNSIPVLIYVAFTAWAAVAQNAFSIDRFTSAVVGYGATLAVLGLSFAALLFGLPILLGPLISSSPVLPVAVTAVCFVAFLPLYRKLKGRLDRAFFRGQDAGSLSEILRQLTTAVQTEAKESALRKALTAVIPLGAERAELWSLSSGGERVHRQRVEGTPSTVQQDSVERQGPLMVSLAIVSGGVAGLCEVVLPQPAQEELWRLELALAVPVRAFGAVAGFIGLGRKRSGTAWEKGELAFCEAVATQAGITLERSREESSQFGRYRVERRLGLGAMAEVFLAWQLGPGGFERRVALKRPLPQLAEDAQSVAMFLDEARLAAQLSHRNIVQVFEVGTVEQVVFMAIEYVDGPALRQAIRRAVEQHKLPAPDVAVAIATRVLDALEHAHQAKDSMNRPLELVHRDVNPNNVLLGTDGSVKLADFGIARAASRIAATQTGLVKGTLPFMSPEQARGEPIDPRTDLYAVAAVLYELLSGRRACPEGPLAGAATPLVEPTVPPALRAVVMRGLSQKPNERFATAGAFRDALVQAHKPAAEPEIAAWLKSLGAFEQSAAAPLATGPGADVVQETRTGRVAVPPRSG